MEKIISPNEEEILRIFDIQKKNKADYARTTASERKERLKKLLAAIYKHSGDIENAVYSDFHKPPSETRLTETYVVIAEIKYALRNLDKWMKPKRVPTLIAFLGSSNWISYAPKGVSLIISPWNFPFLLAIGPLVSAIASGCPVILKPSEITPNTSAYIKEFISQLFDEREVAVFEGDHVTAQALLKLPFDHIYFAGSPAVGKIIMDAASKNLTSVTLELGGKSPAIIDESADLKMVANRITWGKLLNGGQSCVAPDYVVLPEKSLRQFVEFSKETVYKLYGDFNAINTCMDFCRIIDKKHFIRLSGLIKDALENGAFMELGGEADPSDNFMPPTILSNVPMDSKIMREEIFGPVLPLITYHNLQEIEEIVAANPYPLTLYLFSRRKEFIKKMMSSIQSGGVTINDVSIQFANSTIPFGGIKTSGIGKSHGYFGFREFSNQRGIMKQPSFSPLKFLYPPYTKTVNRLIDIMLKYI